MRWPGRNCCGRVFFLSFFGNGFKNLPGIPFPWGWSPPDQVHRLTCIRFQSIDARVMLCFLVLFLTFVVAGSPSSFARRFKCEPTIILYRNPYGLESYRRVSWWFVVHGGPHSTHNVLLDFRASLARATGACRDDLWSMESPMPLTT
jgi:hypothetical protein